MNSRTKEIMFSHASDEYETPNELFALLDEEFGFTLDPCATAKNAKCKKYYTKEQDGLKQSWSGERVFVNPPYSEAGKWVEKSVHEYGDGTLVVVLLPVRTDTKFFHSWVLGVATEIRFIIGRLKFGNRTLPSWKEDGSHTISSAPFPSMLIIYDPDRVGETKVRGYGYSLGNPKPKDKVK